MKSREKRRAEYEAGTRQRRNTTKFLVRKTHGRGH
jgi:hypothetical protein